MTMQINGSFVTPKYEAEHLLFQYGGERIDPRAAKAIKFDVSHMLSDLKSLQGRAGIDTEIEATERVLSFLKIVAAKADQ